MNAPQMSELFDLMGAARYLRVHPNTLRRACLSGRLRHRPGLNGQIWIVGRDLQAYAATLRRRDRGTEEQPKGRPVSPSGVVSLNV